LLTGAKKIRWEKKKNSGNHKKRYRPGKGGPEGSQKAALGWEKSKTPRRERRDYSGHGRGAAE